jgi:hypothetical protein
MSNRIIVIYVSVMLINHRNIAVFVTDVQKVLIIIAFGLITVLEVKIIRFLL